MKKNKKRRAIKKKKRKMKAKELKAASLTNSKLKVGDKVIHNSKLVLIKEIHAGIAELSDGFGVSIKSLERADIDD